MLYLPNPTLKDINSYFDMVKDKLESAIDQSSLTAAVKLHIKTNLKKIITDKPDLLVTHHASVMTIVFPAFTDKGFEAYLKSKRKKKKSPADKKLIRQYSITNQISKIFNYDYLISGDKKVSYALAEQLDRNTCTYCNRLYTITVSVDKSQKITRPQFDHWYAKSLFPALALSFYNLIPSCSVCNSSIKGDKRLSLQTHTHPYNMEAGQDFMFTYGYEKAIDKISVGIQCIDKSKIQGTLNLFKIKEIYNAHSSLELKDLYDLRKKYPDNYLETLANVFDSLPIGKMEAYRLIFGTEYEENNFHKRAFSKFKKDILGQLDVKIT
jgi:hypothetical protein